MQVGTCPLTETEAINETASFNRDKPASLYGLHVPFSKVGGEDLSQNFRGTLAAYLVKPVNI